MGVFNSAETARTIEIVVNDRLLDPLETQVIDHVTPPQSFPKIEALVEVAISSKASPTAP